LLHVLPGCSIRMYESSCNDACQVVNIKTEEAIDIAIKVGEIPEPISFPEIKAEPDEVSYMSVCHRYTKLSRLFSGVCYLGLPTSIMNGYFYFVLVYVNS